MNQRRVVYTDGPNRTLLSLFKCPELTISARIARGIGKWLNAVGESAAPGVLHVFLLSHILLICSPRDVTGALDCVNVVSAHALSSSGLGMFGGRREREREKATCTK